ncbi:hypothetical protein VPHD260_0213 [Vibrio phage D260]
MKVATRARSIPIKRKMPRLPLKGYIEIISLVGLVILSGWCIFKSLAGTTPQRKKLKLFLDSRNPLNYIKGVDRKNAL